MPVKLVLRQFSSPLVLTLVAASVVAFYAGLVKDSYLIFAVLLLNAALGFWQEFKAEKSLQALRKITVSQTRVFRDGEEKKIDNKFLVPGDLIVLESGQTVPADSRILENYSIEVNESALTGESLPVFRAGGEPENNMLYMGTTVTKGLGRALVVETGMRTRFGKLARALKEVKDEPTPFQKSIIKLTRTLVLMAVAAAFAVYFLGVFKGQPRFEIFLVAASLSVAVVPEGLPGIVSLTLALGVQRMAKKNAIVRRMAAVEALGSVTIICTDKTGTLTTGDMAVRHVWAGGRELEIRPSEPAPENLKKIFKAACAGNTASLLLSGGREKYEVVGDTTDGALLVLAERYGQRTEPQIVEEFSFDRNRKILSAVVKNPSGFEVLARGAPEKLLEISSFWQKGEDKIPLASDIKEKIAESINGYAKRGFRIIGFAYKQISRDGMLKREEAESRMVYLGFFAISDPPRPNARTSLEKAKNLGVATMMLTGDNLLTAKAIGDEIGMLAESDEVIEGGQIDKLTDGELDRYIKKVKVVARATPEHKLRIIQSLQRLKEIVAVTGDGVNDSLALKQADVGVAMGRKGTDVAKQASDIILADDNYSTIVEAVEQGRRIDGNLTQVVRYLVAGNLSEALTVFVAVAFGSVTPLLPVQILWVNIVSDALPAFALAVGANRLKTTVPKKAADHPLNGEGLKIVGTASVVVAAASLLAYWHFFAAGVDVARTAVFTVLIVAQMAMAYVIARLHSGKSFHWGANRYLALAIGGTVLLQLLFLLIPGLRQAFHLKLPPL